MSFDVSRVGCGGMVGFAALTATLRLTMAIWWESMSHTPLGRPTRRPMSFDVSRVGCGGMVGFAALTSTLRSMFGDRIVLELGFVGRPGVIGEF